MGADEAAAVGVEGAVMTLDRFTRLQALIPARFVTTERVVEAARMIKDDGEIEVMRQAAGCCPAAALEALAAVRPGRSETEVALEVELALRRGGFSKPAFETIVASGPHSALPHARPGTRVLTAGDGVVLDFGGVYDGYCVDLTRTVQLGPASGSFRRIFDAVREAHAAAMVVRPGIAASAVDTAARERWPPTGWPRRSCTARDMAWALRCTRSRGSPGREPRATRSCGRA